MPWLAVLLFLLALPVHAQIEVGDDYGNTIRLSAPARRIVSLSPHLTELLYAAGAGRHVVGALEHSDYPAQARALPRVGSEAGIDLEKVLALRPDLVVAWPNAGSVRAVNRLAEMGLAVFRSEPRELEDIARTLERLGALAGTREVAQEAAHAFRSRASALEARYSGRRTVRVFYEIWNRPLMTVNGAHVISKVIRLCGGENVFAHLPLIAAEVDREAVLKADPEVIIGSGPAVNEWRAYGGLSAVRHGHLFTVAPELLQRHTPRLLAGAERVCAILEQVRESVRTRS